MSLRDLAIADAINYNKPGGKIFIERMLLAKSPVLMELLELVLDWSNGDELLCNAYPSRTTLAKFLSSHIKEHASKNTISEWLLKVQNGDFDIVGFIEKAKRFAATSRNGVKGKAIVGGRKGKDVKR